MIPDTLGAIIQKLRLNADLLALVNDRIATRHRYGLPPDQGGWQTNEPACTVHLDGGRIDQDLPLERLRVEIRCYAPTAAGAFEVYRAILSGCRSEREFVEVDGQRLLIYSFLPGSGPVLLPAPDLGMEMVSGFFEALVGEIGG